MGTLGSISAAIFLGALIAIAVLALLILICVWTYRDAQHKGMNGIIWTLIVLLVPGCFGLLIYLIVRMDTKKVTCSKCMKSVDGNSKYCSNCGEELVPVVEVEEEDEVFRKSQRRVLIGFFSTLVGVVAATILLIAFLINSVVGIIGNGVKLVSKLDDYDVIGTLNDLDELFGEDGIRFHADEENFIVKDKNGKELMRIDTDSNSVDVDISAIKKIMDEYGIDYDETVTDKEMEEVIQELLEEMEENGFVYFKNRNWNDLSPEEQKEVREKVQKALDEVKEEFEN